MPEVSIIIVTYDSIGFIKSCLDSVKKQIFKGYEVIVVDNGSQDDIQILLKSEYPEVKLIRNNKNQGFSAGNNQGISLSKGRYVLTLNPDAVLDSRFISNVVDFLDNGQNPRVGMVSGKMLRPDGKTLDSTGLVLTNFRRFFDRGAGKPDKGQYDKAERIFGPCAAAAVYKKEMLEDIKEGNEYFDEDFFCFVEDVDLAWRANKKGWIGYYVPEARCYHYRSSRNYKKSLMQYYAFRNRILMNIKNDTLNIFTVLSLIFYDIPRLFFILFSNLFGIKLIKDTVSHASIMADKRKLT